MRVSVLAVLVVFLTSPIGLPAQQLKVSGAVRVVRQLYADFACEAVIDEPDCDSQHQLLDQPRTVLERYFDTALARLWVANRACENRSHESCGIEFLPMWDSQDPAGTFIRILPTADSTKVDVELRHPYYKEPRVLRYTLIRTGAGWRVHDIAKGSEWSLLALLAGKR
jgi:hypothetical protein